MRWEDAPYVKLYRDSGPFMDLSLEARGLFDELLKVVDRAGILRVGNNPIRSISRAVNGVPERVKVYMDELLADGCIIMRDDAMVMKNYIEAQSARSSDKNRQSELRKRARDIAAIPKEREISASSIVYFVRATSGGPVKIGTTNGTVEERIRWLQTGHPEKLEAIHTETGGPDRERELHQRFSEYRTQGEWFKWCDEIAEYIGLASRSVTQRHASITDRHTASRSEEKRREETRREKEPVTPSANGARKPKREPSEESKRLKADSDTAVSEYQAQWLERYRPADGKPPTVAGPDFFVIRSAIKAHGLEAAREYVRRYLADDSPFFVRAAHPLRLLKADAYRVERVTVGVRAVLAPIAALPASGRQKL